MLKNNTIKLFFDYRGTITRREFWAGLIFLLTLVLFDNSVSTMYHLIFQSMYSNMWDSSSYIAMHTNFLQPTFTVNLPTLAILLYSSIIICIKRSRTLSLRPYIGYISGIITYMSFSSLKSLNTIFFYSVGGTPRYELVNLLTGFAYFLLFILVIGVIFIIRLSFRSNSDNNPASDNYDTTKCLLSIGKLYISIVGATIIAGLLIGYANNGDSISILAFLFWFTCAITIIGTIIYLYILSRRAEDAYISLKTFLIPFITYFLITGIVYYFTTLSFENISDKYIYIYDIVMILFTTLSTAYIIGTFLFIGLPSKQNNLPE